LTLYLIGVVAMGWNTHNRWYLDGTTGQSAGKKVLKIRLVREETGQPIGILMAFPRDICHIVDSIICSIGYLSTGGMPSGRPSLTRSSTRSSHGARRPGIPWSLH
jgi:hypothetical protein